HAMSNAGTPQGSAAESDLPRTATKSGWPPPERRNTLMAATTRPVLQGWARLCVAIAVVVATFGAVLSTGFGGPEISQTISNLGLCVGAVSAALACLLRARSFRGRMRWGWALIGLGVLAWGLGQAAWVYLESYRGDEVPFPSQADIGYLGMVVLTPAGLLILPSAAQALANRARSVLDGLMVATSLVLIAWIIIIDPMIH